MSDDDSILPTELDSGSDGDSVCAAASSTAVQAEHTANTAQVPSSIPGTTLDDHVEHDDDPYGFLERERDEKKRPKRSRTPTRSEIIAARPKIVLGSTGEAPSASSSGNSNSYADSVFYKCMQQTVNLNMLPRSMQAHANRNTSLMPELIYSYCDKLGKVAYHLQDKFPGRNWKSYLPQVAEFGKFCNTLQELRDQEALCQSSFKYGATACLVRRWYDLGPLCKSYTHLFYYITESLAESSSLESALINSAKTSSDPIRRRRCENNTVGGEGLGQDREGFSKVAGHFVYLAVAKNR